MLFLFFPTINLDGNPVVIFYLCLCPRDLMSGNIDESIFRIRSHIFYFLVGNPACGIDILCTH